MPKKTPNPIDRHVGQRVRQARHLLDMSQEKLSAGLGLTFQQVQKYEKGTNRISASKLVEISGIVKRPVSWFFEELPNQADMLRGPQPDDPVQNLANTHLGVEIARALSAITDNDARHDILKFIGLIGKHSVVVVAARKAA